MSLLKDINSACRERNEEISKIIKKMAACAGVGGAIGALIAGPLGAGIGGAAGAIFGFVRGGKKG